MQSFVVFDPFGSGEVNEKAESLKADGQTDRRTNDGRQSIRKTDTCNFFNYLQEWF